MKNIFKEEVSHTWIADEIRAWLDAHADERSLAAAMAYVWNEDVCLSQELDLESGAVDEEISQNWWDLNKELVDTIASILENESSVKIERVPYLSAIEPFMNRNKFFYNSGFWIEQA